VQPASALLPPCVHPLPHRLLVLVPQLDADFALFEQVGAAVSAAARQARMVTWRPGATAAAQLRLRPPPSALSNLHLARRPGGVPVTCLYGRHGRAPISL